MSEPDLKPRVKPLEWQGMRRDGDADWWINHANTEWGTYSVKYEVGKYALLQATGIVWEPCESEEAAKAAAQADYERRILSALDLAPVTPAQAAEVLELMSGKIAQMMNVYGVSNDLVHDELQAALKAIKEGK
jgi:hypothetical protein